MIGTPIVGTNPRSTAVVIYGIAGVVDQHLSADQALEMAADLTRNAHRVKKVEAMKSQANLNLTGRRS
jgi:hypothetical protein